jgi:hypothetical protein
VTVTANSGITGMGTITAVYYTGATYTKSTTPPTDAGNYTITIDVNEGIYYTAETDLTLGTFTITNASATAIWGNTSFVYTGTPQAPTAIATAIDGSTITLNVSGDETDAGTYTATASYPNYTLLNATTTFTIAPAEITVIANGGSSIYGDSPANPGILITNALTGETVNANIGLYNNFYITATTPAGSYQLLVEGTLTNSNYTVVKKETGLWRVYRYAGADVSGAPTKKGLPTGNSISVHEVTIPVNPGNQTVEYAISTSLYLLEGWQNSLVWQSGTTFTGLSEGVTYYVYARSAANENYAAGVAKISEAITTNLTGIDDVQPAKSLIAWTQNGMLHISGLTVNKPWSVYNISGELTYQSIAENEKADISLPVRGVYIVRSGDRIVKTVF